MYIVMSLFLGKLPNPDPFDPNSYSVRISPNGYDFLVHKDSLYAAGFKADDKIYCMVAAETEQCAYNGFYFDISSGKNVYTGYSPIHSEVKNFILP
jgi:hypothetical protein